MIVTDIEGNILNVGDEVYYARKQNSYANGELKKVTITKIVSEFEVKMGRYTSTEPYKQLIKIK